MKVRVKFHIKKPPKYEFYSYIMSVNNYEILFVPRGEKLVHWTTDNGFSKLERKIMFGKLARKIGVSKKQLCALMGFGALSPEEFEKRTGKEIVIEMDNEGRIKK